MSVVALPTSVSADAGNVTVPVTPCAIVVFPILNPPNTVVVDVPPVEPSVIAVVDPVDPAVPIFIVFVPAVVIPFAIFTVPAKVVPFAKFKLPEVIT